MEDSGFEFDFSVVKNLGLRIKVSAFEVMVSRSLGFRVWGLEYGIWDLGCRVQGLGFRI